uniref:(California timema) hypothetical protein n=1 Tax=Timema californicum TaxID=61474 RepID=A0A7R9JB29_TIMCA|nr:unnamed protein product [Timema californicum]
MCSKFEMFDYGSANEGMYGDKTPPTYDLNRGMPLVSVVYSMDDNMAPDKVFPKCGMATTIVTADTLLSACTVLPSSAGTSLPGPSHSRNDYKRRKRYQEISLDIEVKLINDLRGHAATQSRGQKSSSHA